jgi:hypothetical protein
MKTTDILTNVFYVKDKLKAYIDTQSNGVEKIIQLARDRELVIIDGKETRKKKYHYIPCDEVNKLRGLLNINTFLYEILAPDVPVKPYFDLEVGRDGITSQECEYILNEFINLVTTEFQSKYDVTLERDDFIVLNSCRANKLSYHLIIQNKIYFESVVAHNQFIKQIHSVVMETNCLFWDEDGKRKIIMDTGVYDKDRCFRCINQSKMGSDFILVNTNIDPIDSLIRLYWGEGDRKVIKYDEAKGLRQSRAKTDKVRQTKKEKAQETDVMNLYDTKGITLMEKKQLTYTDLKNLPEWKQYLYLIPNTAQHRAVFVKVGFCLANCVCDSGDDNYKEHWREWAKLSKKYTVGRQIDDCNNPRKGEGASNLSFLKLLAQKAHPNYFDEGLLLLHESYLKPDYKGMNIIEEDCEFVSQENTIHENNILIDKKLILLVARLGGGKTTAINRLIKQKNYKRILFVSPRTSFSYFVAEEFGLTVYLDRGANLHDDKLVISVESLWKLAENGVKPYDLVILDEIEANLSVFSSITCKKQWKNWNDLTELIKQSKQTITAGAFITQKTIDFMMSFNLPTVCIKNTTRAIQRKAIELSPKYFILTLIESIKRGEKNYCCYSSLRQMTDDIAELRNEINDPIVREVIENALVYSSEGDDALQKYQLRNMSVEWKKVKLVMTTPTVTVGNSYTICDFDNVFIRSSPTCIVADIFQCHRRVRYTKQNTLYFSLPTVGIKTYNKRFREEKIEILRNFNERNTRKVVLLLKNLIKEKEKQQFKNEIEDNRIDIDTLLHNLEHRKISPLALQELLKFNFMENALSQGYYDEMFIEFLTLNNYDTVFLPKEKLPENIKKVLDKELQELKDNAVYDGISYQDIPTIEEYELEDLRSKQTHKEATRIEKLQINALFFNKKTNATEEQFFENLTKIQTNHEEYKAEIEKLYKKEDKVVDFFNDDNGTKLEFNDIFNSTIDSNKLKQYIHNILFKEYVLNTHNGTYYDNYRAEINNKSMVALSNNIIDPNTTTNETISTKPMKLDYIQEINKRLGIPNTGTSILEKKVVIQRSQITEIMPYLVKEHDDIITAFGLSTKQSKKIDSFTNTIALLNTIYKLWNRCSFFSIADSHKKVTAVQLKPHPSYVFFTPFVKPIQEKIQGCLITLDEEDCQYVNTFIPPQNKSCVIKECVAESPSVNYFTDYIEEEQDEYIESTCRSCKTIGKYTIFSQKGYDTRYIQCDECIGAEKTQNSVAEKRKGVMKYFSFAK